MGRETVKRVLVVEDDREAVRLLVALLRNEPYRLLWASSAADGLRLARLHGPDAILVSWTLPEMNGDEFVELLDRNPETASLPLVLFGLEPWVFGSEARTRAAQAVNKDEVVDELAPRIREALRLSPAPETTPERLAVLRDRSAWWRGEDEEDWRPVQRDRLRSGALLGV